MIAAAIVNGNERKAKGGFYSMADEVVVSDLAKSYGSVVALAGVSFSIGAGEIFGILGRNGAGKTTCVECVIGLRRSDRGAIQIHGIDAIANPRKIKELIGVQLQATALQDKITPREALKLFASFYPRSDSIDSLIERFLLTEKADAHFDTLSGGQRQRLALALAVVHQPNIVFLDEPTAGLDVQSRRQLHEIIRDIKKEERTIVLTTHTIEEAGQLCDRIAVIHQGKIIACGSPESLIGERGETLEDAFVRLTGEHGDCLR
jgi:ABC-2 type transport system ATP-binding protein